MATVHERAPGRSRERSRHRKTSSSLRSAECQLALMHDVCSHVFPVCPSFLRSAYQQQFANASLQGCSWLYDFAARVQSVFVCVSVLWPAIVVTRWQRCLKLCPVGYARPLECFISCNSPRRDTLLTASHGFGSEGE